MVAAGGPRRLSLWYVTLYAASLVLLATVLLHPGGPAPVPVGGGDGPGAAVAAMAPVAPTTPPAPSSPRLPRWLAVRVDAAHIVPALDLWLRAGGLVACGHAAQAASTLMRLRALR